MFQDLPTKKSGFTLIDKGLGRWEIHYYDGIYSGNKMNVCRYAEESLGFNIDEISYAFVKMEINFHNATEFSTFKRFIQTYDIEETYAKNALN